MQETLFQLQERRAAVACPKCGKRGECNPHFNKTLDDLAICPCGGKFPMREFVEAGKAVPGEKQD